MLRKKTIPRAKRENRILRKERRKSFKKPKSRKGSGSSSDLTSFWHQKHYRTRAFGD